MTVMMVVCSGDAGTRFDRDYYVREHFALAMECWGPHGLQSVEAFFPAGDGGGWMSIGAYRFREPGDPARALASPETARIMADVPNFTDSRDIARSLFAPMRDPDGLGDHRGRPDGD